MKKQLQKVLCVMLAAVFVVLAVPTVPVCGADYCDECYEVITPRDILPTDPVEV